MKLIIITISMLLIGCQSSMDKSGKQMNAKDDFLSDSLSGPQYLLRACAYDVQKQYPASGVQFSTCLTGYKLSESGEKTELLCGQFRVEESNGWGAWIPFATLRTAAYEQWQGEQASAYCRDAGIVWNSLEDVSVDLQRLLEELRGNGLK